ncbi:MAG: hypothetical protein AAF846_13125 [Chloroflexota bacterium]
MSQQIDRRQNPQARQRRKSRPLSSTQVMFAVILAIALMLAVQFSARITSERNLNQIRNTVQDEIEFLRNEQSNLIDELDFVQSDAYVEQWARAEGRMVQDNMVLVVPLQIDDVVQQTPIEETVAVIPEVTELETTLPDPEPWQLWWALFFDAPPPQFNT